MTADRKVLRARFQRWAIPQLEALAEEWEKAAVTRKDYNTRRAYAKCAADIRFLISQREHHDAK